MPAFDTLAGAVNQATRNTWGRSVVFSGEGVDISITAYFHAAAEFVITESDGTQTLALSPKVQIVDADVAAIGRRPQRGDIVEVTDGPDADTYQIQAAESDGSGTTICRLRRVEV